MLDSSTLGAGDWLWLPFLSSQGMGNGQSLPLKGVFGIGGEQSWAKLAGADARNAAAPVPSSRNLRRLSFSEFPFMEALLFHYGLRRISNIGCSPCYP